VAKAPAAALKKKPKATKASVTAAAAGGTSSARGASRPHTPPARTFGSVAKMPAQDDLFGDVFGFSG
jgi:hypothetical protein